MKRWGLVIVLCVSLTACSTVNVLAQAMKGFGTPSSAQRQSATVQGRGKAVPAAVVDYSKVPDQVTVKKGDTLYSVSKTYNVPMGYIIDANNLDAPYTVKVGQKLKLPKPNIHTVGKSETLYSIARAYGVYMDAIVQENHLAPPYTLYVGQKLVIPSATVTAAGGESKVASSVVPSPKPSKNEIKKDTNKEQNKNNASKVTREPPPRSSSRFSWPLKGKTISSFGGKAGGLHNDGINIAATRGSTVKAAENGVVAYAGDQIKGYGNLVLIKHQDSYVTAYAHLDSIDVAKGQTVKVGQKIATVGSTGNVGSPQLHFEIRKGRRAVDPVKFLK